MRQTKTADRGPPPCIQLFQSPPSVHVSRLGAVRAARVVPLALGGDVMTPRLAMTIGRRRRRLLELRIGVAMRMVDAEHALDPADHAADRGADHRADRTRDAVAFVKAVRGPARNALRLRRQRRREACKEYAREYCQSHCRP